MDVTALVETKRGGGAWSADEAAGLVEAYTAGRIDDEAMTQVVAAIFEHDLSEHELAAWTRAMLESGDVLDWSALDKPVVDKHSTGGVGDSVSLPLAPAVAACGAAVPMVSGRALGHSGGTLDKLESIPGFRVDVSLARARELMAETGLVLMGQTAELAPADRRLYALRDATGYVASRPLIVSSIMSKKLAEGLDGLVLDVKVGSGAFMRSEAEARQLARSLADTGAGVGCPVVAWLTRMDRPLGRAVGNALEVAESLDVLTGGGPPDLLALTTRLGGEMLALVGLASSPADGAARIADVLRDGSAAELFARQIELQGGDPRVLDDRARLPAAPVQRPVHAAADGWLGCPDASELGRLVMALGAGRSRPGEQVDPSVGVVLACDPGDAVTRGQPVAVIHAADDGAATRAAEQLAEVCPVLAEQPERAPLFGERLTAGC